MSFSVKKVPLINVSSTAHLHLHCLCLQVFTCPSCHSVFCVECDLFIHDSLHCCPCCIHSRRGPWQWLTKAPLCSESCICFALCLILYVWDAVFVLWFILLSFLVHSINNKKNSLFVLMLYTLTNIVLYSKSNKSDFLILNCHSHMCFAELRWSTSNHILTSYN